VIFKELQMNETRRTSVAVAIERERVSAIIRTNDRDIAFRAMREAVEGGFRVVEFTLTTPDAVKLISEFRQNPELLVGAGTVLTVAQARETVSAGAQFLVSPVVDPVVIAEAAALDVPSIPGAYTPTEMQAAHRAGADFVKVFPAPVNGVEAIEAIRGPLPHLRLFPTAGITLENFTEFLDAGCAGVGFVRSLFDPAELARGDVSAIRARAERIIQRLAAWRESH
jgi:2-dehydro-3-deoxyphosphogluconate aldolase/(4S)-4-hydroxy-2-oxoglutarate aldolase